MSQNVQKNTNMCADNTYMYQLTSEKQLPKYLVY